MKREETDNLDLLLSERLKSAVGDGGVANWLDVRRRVGESGPSVGWSKRRLLLVAAVLVLAVGACARSTGVIPWLNQKPAKPKYHPPRPVPACAAVDLKAQLFLQGETGSRVGGIDLENVSQRPCSLVGQPKVSFIGAATRVTKWRVKRTTRFFPFENTLQLPLASLWALQPGGKASIDLWWSNWCGPGSTSTGGSGRPLVAIVLRLRSGSRIVVPLQRVVRGELMVPRCDDAQEPSLLEVSRVVPVSMPGPSSQLPLRATIVGKKTVHHHGRRFLLHRGSIFRYGLR